METYQLKENILLFGMQVTTFPAGIPETFDALANQIEHGHSRPYYGISWMSGNAVIYYAMASELSPGEADRYDYKKMMIEEGTYATVSVKDWLKKTDSIKDVFHNLMQERNVAHDKPCIEWYKSDEEMVCMIKMI